MRRGEHKFPGVSSLTVLGQTKALRQLESGVLSYKTWDFLDRALTGLLHPFIPQHILLCPPPFLHIISLISVLVLILIFALFLWAVITFFCLLNKSKLEGETLVLSLLFFVSSHTYLIFFCNTSTLASMQITPSVLHIIMFNDLAVEIKIYLKVFRKKKKTLGIFYNSTDWKIYKCLLGVIQELHFPLTVWEAGPIYDSACNQWSIMFQGNGEVLYKFRFCH